MSYNEYPIGTLVSFFTNPNRLGIVKGHTNQMYPKAIVLWLSDNYESTVEFWALKEAEQV